MQISAPKSLFSERSQRAILWWGIGLGIVYGLSLVALLQMVPPPSATWPAARVAEFYQEHSLRIRWGAVIAAWTGGFMMPILVVVSIQMARVETGGAKVWSALSLVSGAFMSLFLVLPPIFFGVAAFTPSRAPEITSLMHELGVLTLVSTAQYYIFMWIGVTVIAFRSATQLVPHNPFPRWWGYLSLWITLMLELGPFAFLPRSGVLSWNGLLVFWSPVTLFTIWVAVQSWLVFRALRGQVALKQGTELEVPTGTTAPAA